MQWLAIILTSILACVAYGIVHDQVTARICIEYFTIGHPQIVTTDDPTTLGFVWGVLATWWVGAILGVPLAAVARVGSRPKKSVADLWKPMAMLLACCAFLACIAGTAGYVAATQGWAWLVGPIAQRVPPERHVAFLVDLWAHGASYLGGFFGGVVLMIWVWRSRCTPEANERIAEGQQ